ncbi:hypothetical protein Q4I32_000431 [Leishmania shawi]|uniref:Secreted protein n=1 Tax=Leishmania shawi TaxID=5680 RepID=A0AAW3CC29_9TRYP
MHAWVHVWAVQTSLLCAMPVCVCVCGAELPCRCLGGPSRGSLSGAFPLNIFCNFVLRSFSFFFEFAHAPPSFSGGRVAYLGRRKRSQWRWKAVMQREAQSCGSRSLPYSPATGRASVQRKRGIGASCSCAVPNVCVLRDEGEVIDTHISQCGSEGDFPPSLAFSALALVYPDTHTHTHTHVSYLYGA